MDFKLKDKVAMVTGSGSQRGYGKGIALCLAQEGCDIVSVDIDIEGANKTAQAARSLGRKAIAIKTDVSNMDEVNSMAKTALDQFGRIDILVNNAGTSCVLKPFLEMDKAERDLLINVNLHGQMNVSAAVVPHMVSRGYGRVINISGGEGGANISVYGASKGGVVAFTESLAKEVAPLGVVVNGIHPGLGDTGLNYLGRGSREFTESERQATLNRFMLKRFCTPEDIGVVAAFLASDVCSYMVGQFIHMTGTAR
jgi:3-oxoacyl-[acyl-carrier protein] reductase